MIHLQALGNFIVSHPFAIILSMLAYMIIGSLWYSPMMFMKPWAKMTGIDKVKKDKLKKPMIMGMMMGLLVSFVQAVVLGRTMQITSMGHWSYALMIATILWFPFVFLVMAQSYAYTMKSWKLLLIDAGYQLIAMWAMALVLYATIL